MSLVLRAVEDQVGRSPDAPAIRFSGQEVSYSELWSRSGEVARRLVELGAGPGRTVGIHLERSAELVVVLVGVLRSGAIAVPLDVSYPPERLRYMCADAEIGLLVGHAEHVEQLGGLRVVETDGGVVYATRDAAEVVLSPDVAYIVYTSGSTGRPKGVLYEHSTLANLIGWQIEASGCGAGDRTLQFSAASFDVIFQEVLTTLGEGGTVVCCSEEDRLDPLLLWELIEREQVNRLFVPFVVLQSMALFADEVAADRHRLREVLTTGEQMQISSRIREVFHRLPDCRLINQWGTTETHVATWHLLPRDVADWPALPSIGVPIRGTRIQVCDDDGRPVSGDEVGELWISGACVGPGYLNLPERTAAAYVPDPLEPALRSYRTGDLGRLGAEGYECLGRRDTQVKIRGFRIELGEIETLINSIPFVVESVVAAIGTTAEERHLQAFVVLGSDGVQIDQIQTALRRQLPEHMIPSRITIRTSLPRTPSGKLDRRAVS